MNEINMNFFSRNQRQGEEGLYFAPWLTTICPKSPTSFPIILTGMLLRKIALNGEKGLRSGKNGARSKCRKGYTSCFRASRNAKGSIVFILKNQGEA